MMLPVRPQFNHEFDNGLIIDNFFNSIIDLILKILFFIIVIDV